MSATVTPQTNTEQRYAELIAKAAEKITSLKAELEDLKQRDHEPIAIIGMGCRFPLADDLEAYWTLLANGTDAIQEPPIFHTYLDQLYDLNPDAVGKVYANRAGFLQQSPAAFDAEFFGISSVEAASMDPQHRLLLEVTWEALENAGIVPEELSGSMTGVFTGICSNDYVWQLVKQDPRETDVYFGSGNAYSPAAGRVSFLLDVHGPCMAVDTGCASSLTSTYLAVNSLRLGECDMAIVGGVQRYLSPEYWVNLCRSRILSPDARCKTFAADADGYARGEGCGVIILKRLSDALKAKDNIAAVIQGIATGHGGRTGGLTVPNGSVQQTVIRRALENAQIRSDDVDYIEAHGTGTSLGDPIEMNAIGKVFRDRSVPLLVGSAKTNIGHLEGSAGVAGLIKVVLSLQNEALPKHLHFSNPSPHIAWDEIDVKIVTEKMPWKKSDKKRIAGLSSFGFEGVNVHAVISEAPEKTVRSMEHTLQNSSQLITLSAQSEVALKELVMRYTTYLEGHLFLELCDIAYTSTCRRAHHGHRLAIIASSLSDFCDKLKLFLSGQKSGSIFCNSKKSHHYQESSVTIALQNSEDNLALLAQNYVDGANVDWKELHKNYQHHLVNLPTYAWQRKDYWIDASPSYQTHSSHHIIHTESSTIEEQTYLSEQILTEFAPSNQLYQRLHLLDNNQRSASLIGYIKEQLPNNDVKKWELSDSFFDMGMNSLAMVELRLHLQAALDINLPSTLLYTHPTIGDLVDYLLLEIGEVEHVSESLA